MATRDTNKGGRKKTAEREESGRLFELAPEEFVAARNQLAKRLAAEGDPEASRAIKALRRPTVGAWTVNQLVRRHPKEIAELLASGGALRQAQRKVLSGVRTADFREASERRRRLVTDLARKAEEILHEAGHAAPGTVESVRSTLEAASLDDEAGDLVRTGRLTKELPPPATFGAVAGLGLVPSPPEEKPEGPRARKRSGSQVDEEEARALRAKRDDAVREAKTLTERAAQARRAAIKARREADRSEAQAEKLRQDAEKARAGAREMGKKAQQAETEATRAQEAAERAERRSLALR